MASLNRVLLIGRLTRDPVSRTTPSGQQLTELGLAINARFTGKDGNTREDVTFVSVTAWGRTAETCAEYLRKGSEVFIEGRLKLDEWEKDGQKRSKLTVTAEKVQFMGSKAKGGHEQDGGAAGGGYEKEPPTRQPASDDDFPGRTASTQEEIPF